MKTVQVPQQAGEVNQLLNEAREEDILVRAADGSEFMLVAVDDFDREIARTRLNEKLMAFLEGRARQNQTIPLAEVKRQLGL